MIDLRLEQRLLNSASLRYLKHSTLFPNPHMTPIKPGAIATQFLIVLIAVSAYGNAFGQTKMETGLDYIDKHGVKIKLANSLLLSQPVDRDFLIENLHSELLLPRMDTLKNRFEFIIAEIKPREKNKSYEVKVISYAVSAEKRPISKPIYRVYEMRLNSKNSRFYIQEFSYEFMEF